VVIKLDENFYRVDHAPCALAKILVNGCWRAFSCGS